MLIKKSAGRFELKSYLKKKSVLFFIIFFLNSLFFTFLGFYAYHSGFASKVNKFISYDSNYRFSVVKNFVKKPLNIFLRKIIYIYIYIYIYKQKIIYKFNI